MIISAQQQLMLLGILAFRNRPDERRGQRHGDHVAMLITGGDVQDEKQRA
jgi:hypothetical protein